MDLKKEYKTLYQHWINEFESSDLTNLSDKTYSNYKELIEFLDTYEIKKDEKLKNDILKEYDNNFNFLFDDLLKIRINKITNKALSLEEIDINKLFEAEKLLYQNLIASIKGYQKIKTLSTYENNKLIKSEELEISSDKTKIVERENGFINNKNDEKVKDGSDTNEVLEKVNYKLIRILEPTPALVGIDLINYGPFQKEDIVNLPYENAKILANEKNAVFIDIS